MIEGITVIVSHYCLAADLTVTCIRRFLPVRAVAHRAAVEIVFKTSSPDCVDLIEKGIGGRELRISLHICIDDFCRHIVFR